MKIAAPPLILNEPPAHTCNGGMKKCDRGAEGLRSARVLHAGGGRRAGRVGFKTRTQMRRGDASCGAVCRLGAYLEQPTTKNDHFDLRGTRRVGVVFGVAGGAGGT